MFLSVVNKISKPAASAAAMSSPFTSLSHPRSMASTTTWPFKTYRSGEGVPLSKGMSIWRGSGERIRSDARDRSLHISMYTGRCVQTPRREFKYRAYLVTRQVEPFHHLADRRSRFQIVKHDRDRRPRVTEYPRTATFAGDAFH